MVRISALGTTLLAATAAVGHDGMDMSMPSSDKPLRVGFLLFPGFEPLDVMGPFEVWSSLSFYYNMTMSFIAHKAGPVTSLPPPHMMAPGEPLMDLSYMISTSVVATHSFEDAPELDVLLVPGGLGNVVLEQAKDTSLEDFVAARFDSLKYLLSVCTGSVTLANAGVLKGKKATTNKASWAWVTSHGEGIQWVPSARWTEDGKIWTSSGVSAGIDMTYAFLKHLYGPKNLNTVMNLIEYTIHADKNWDPFAIVHNVPGANTSEPLEDCVKPVPFITE